MIRKSDELLSIGEVSERTGVAVSAVRYYETLGLVPAERTAGNMRKFPRHSIRRVSLIQLAVRFGIPLAEVAEVFGSLPQGANSDEEGLAQDFDGVESAPRGSQAGHQPDAGRTDGLYRLRVSVTENMQPAQPWRRTGPGGTRRQTSLKLLSVTLFRVAATEHSTDHHDARSRWDARSTR